MKRTRDTLFTEVGGLILLAMCVRAELAAPSVVPAPQEMIVRGTDAPVGDQWRIVVEESVAEDVFAAQRVQTYLMESCDLWLDMEDLSACTTGSRRIVMGDPSQNALLAEIAEQKGVSLSSDFDPQGYVLDVTTDNVLIVATDSHGLFYGAETLKQLFSGGGQAIAAGVRITDYPDLPWRGVYLCGAGYDTSSLNPSVFGQIDELARLRINYVEMEHVYNAHLDDTGILAQVESAFLRCRNQHVEPIPAFVPWYVSAIDPNTLSGAWMRDEEFRFVDDLAESTQLPPDLSLFLTCESYAEITNHGASVVETGTGQVAFTASVSTQYMLGVHLDGSNTNCEQILIPSSLFNPNEGTVEFWFQPKWDDHDGQNHHFLDTPYGDNCISLAKLDNNYLYWSIRRNGVFHRLCTTDAHKWSANEWHHLAVTWGPGGSEIYLDGQPVRPLLFQDDVYTGDVCIPVTNVTLGSEHWGTSPADCVFDEVRIWNKQRVPWVDRLPAYDTAVQNGDFETDADTNDIPDGWTTGSPLWSWDTPGYHSNRCMKVDVPSLVSTDSGLWGTAIAATSNTWYNLRYFAKIQDPLGGTAPAIRVTELDASGAQLLQTNGAWVQHNSILDPSAGWGDWWQKGELCFKTDPRCAKLQVYANIYNGYGKAWFDDIKLRRLSGSLLNMLRTESTDATITDLAKTQTYERAVDYEVDNAELADWYSSDNQPARIRRLPGSRIEPDQKVLVSYDAGIRLYCGSSITLPYCYSEPRVYNILYDAVDRFLDNPLLNPKYVDIGQYSEIRGVNRDSRDLTRNKTNAELLAEDLNKLHTHIQGKDPSVRMLIWDDMINPWHNGDNDSYQVEFSGLTGAMSSAINLISTDLIVDVWWYDAGDTLGKLSNSPAYFHSHGFDWMGAAWKDTSCIDEWVDIANARPDCLGLMGTDWPDGGGWIGSLAGVRYLAQQAWARHPRVSLDPPDFVGCWSMDEGTGSVVSDASTNHLDGVLYAPESAWTSGVTSGGLRFDGANDYVEVPDAAVLNADTALTIMCWVNVASWTNTDIYADVVNKFTGGSPGAGYLICREISTDDLMFQLRTATGGLMRWTGALETGRWYHVAGTFDGTQLLLYVNGSTRGTWGNDQDMFAETQPILPYTGPLKIGGQGGWNSLDGTVDDVKVYRRALSVPEIWAEIHKADTDRDGIPDRDEGGATPYLVGADDQHADADGDGFPNSAEYIAGTGATDPHSHLAAEGKPHASGTSFVVEWPSTTRRRYRVDRCADLDLPFIPLVQDLPATPPMNVYTDTVPDANALFYRIGVKK